MRSLRSARGQTTTEFVMVTGLTVVAATLITLTLTPTVRRDLEWAAECAISDVCAESDPGTEVLLTSNPTEEAAASPTTTAPAVLAAQLMSASTDVPVADPAADIPLTASIAEPLTSGGRTVPLSQCDRLTGWRWLLKCWWGDGTGEGISSPRDAVGAVYQLADAFQQDINEPLADRFCGCTVASNDPYVDAFTRDGLTASTPDDGESYVRDYVFTNLDNVWPFKHTLDKLAGQILDDFNAGLISRAEAEARFNKLMANARQALKCENSSVAQ